MTPEKIHMVQASFDKILPVAETVSALFYNRLFELDPLLRPIFPVDLQGQGHKLIAMIHVVVANLGRLDTVVPAIQALGRRHSSYGVADQHYETFCAALIWALERCLADDFTPEVRGAWVEMYAVLSNTMKAATQVPALNPVVM